MTLTPATYWQLVALDKQVALAKAEAESHITKAILAKQAFLGELSHTHPEFDWTKAYTATETAAGFELS